VNILDDQSKFTFASITFNHKSFIIEHLESIKYQIITFGKNFQVEFILCDDNSSDETFEIANKWLELNNSLFAKVQIIKNNKNLGINKNFLQTISKISTKRFKMIAGDDLYFKNNVFLVNTSSDITFSPVIKFNGINITGFSSVQRLVIIKNNYYFRMLLKLENVFNAPGSFLLLKLFNDKNLITYLSNYSFLEDYPLWFYLFNKYKDIKVKIDLYPYVIYRIGSGISTQKIKSHNQFDSDLRRFKTLNKIPYNKFQKYFKPSKYINKLIQLLLLKPFSFFFKDVVMANKIINDEVSIAQSYINLIKDNSNFFEKNYL
jgi:hypothetical protein